MTKYQNAIIAGVSATIVEIVCFGLFLGPFGPLTWIGIVLLYPAMFISKFLLVGIGSDMLKIVVIAVLCFLQFFLLFWFFIDFKWRRKFPKL